MVRIVKDADERRQELLDTALRFFVSGGFEHTSVAEITGAVGVAKGTFYHYFTSKQDLLEQLVLSFSDEMFGQLEARLPQVTGDAVTRMRALFQLSSTLKIDRLDETMAFARSLYLDDNVQLRTKLMRVWMQRLRPLFGAIVADGARDGVFAVDDPQGAADAFLWMWLGLSEQEGERIAALADHPEEAAALVPVMERVEKAMERIMGVPPGGLGLELGKTIAALGGAR